MEAKKHPFESSGLGRAPFRCVGVSEQWFEMPGFGRKPGGSCAYCGTGILYAFAIKSSDGAEFVVGSDCVAKTDKAVGEATAGFRAERLKFDREQRAKKAAGRHEARQAAWAVERAERAAIKSDAWVAENGELAAALRAYAGANEFVRSMIAALDAWGCLSKGQTEAVERTLATEARIERQRASAKHVGVIGKRTQALVRVVRAICIYRGRGHYDPSRYLTIFETDAGDPMVWFSSDAWAPGPELFAMKFTPKAHEWRDGIPQTIILRPAEMVEKAKAA